MEQEQQGAADQYVIFGDSAYKHQSHIRSYRKATPGVVDDLRSPWNSAMKSTRISIEWNYGTTASHFKYMCNRSKMKLLESPTVAEIYTIATLF